MLQRLKSTWQRVQALIGPLSWKTCARVNTICILLIGLLLLVILIVSSTAARGVNTTYMIYSDGCSGNASALNTVLHLIINILSTAILASSNFFMQVLSAPSRQECVDAHMKGMRLDIGVPSWRNVFRISRTKTLLWFLFFISSVPIHLLFNSVVFQSSHRSSSFSLTIAADSFLTGSPWYGPGASLSPAPGLDKSNYLGNGSWSTGIDRIPLESRNWENKTSKDCQNEYSVCNGIGSYRNVVIIVDSHKSGGWRRQQIHHLSKEESKYWDPIVPASESNSLWYSSPCSMHAIIIDEAVSCENSCQPALGGNQSINSNDGSWYLDFSAQWSANITVGTNITLGPPGWKDVGTSNGMLHVKYCLAEPIGDECSKVWISNILLLAVTICTLIKLICCLVVTGYVDHRPSLVLLGDAISAFIKSPDQSTAHLCQMSDAEFRTIADIRPQVRQWESESRRRGVAISDSLWGNTYLFFALTLAGMASIVGIVLGGKNGIGGSILQDKSTPSVSSVESLISGVLVVNTPQLLFSLYYLHYNALYTRMEMGREWASYSTKYKPLRVTDPRGEQCSSYFLQLRAKFSIPLLVGSMFLHWMLSNSFYIIISNGDYYQNIYSFSRDPSLPNDTIVSFGYSSMALLILFIVLIIMVFIPEPIAWSLKLPGSMPIVRSNSFAIAAACHVSSITRSNISRTESRLATHSTASQESIGDPETDITSHDDPAPESTDTQIEMQQLMNPANSDVSNEPGFEFQTEEEIRKMKSESRIKWGVVKMPPYWYETFEHFDHPVEHLSFGAEKEDTMQQPENGRWYA